MVRSLTKLYGKKIHATRNADRLHQYRKIKKEIRLFKIHMLIIRHELVSKLLLSLGRTYVKPEKLGQRRQ